jgi:O-antigen/teichoic acid export membrane protein
MTEELKTVWGHSRVYGLGTILNRGAGLILIPVYAHVLPAEAFGLYALVVMTTDLVGIFFGVGLVNAMACLYFDYPTQTERNRIVSTAFLSFGVLVLACGALIYPLALLSNMIVFGDQNHSQLFVLAYFGMIFSLLFDLGLGYIRLRKQSWVYLGVSLAKTLLFLSLNLWFVVALNMSVEGIFYGTLLSSLVLAIALVVAILKQVGMGFSKTALFQMLKIGLPLGPAAFADSLLEATDKYFLNRFFSPALVGQYALGNRIASLLNMFITAPFGQIWVIRRLETMQEPNEDVRYSNVFTYFIIVIASAGLGLALFGPEIIRLIASADYFPAVAVIPLLALSYIFIAVNMHFQIGIYHAKKTKFLMAISVSCLLMNIPMNFLLIPMMGMVGAALTMLATSALRAGLTAWANLTWCRKPIDFEWGRVAAILGSAALVYGIGFAALGTSVSVSGGVVKFGLLALFWISLFTARIMTEKERHSLWEFVRHPYRVSTP